MSAIICLKYYLLEVIEEHLKLSQNSLTPCLFLYNFCNKMVKVIFKSEKKKTQVSSTQITRRLSCFPVHRAQLLETLHLCESPDKDKEKCRLCRAQELNSSEASWHVVIIILPEPAKQDGCIQIACSEQLLISELFLRIIWKVLLGPNKMHAANHQTTVQMAVSAISPHPDTI